jgi:hypothetical protein
VPAPGKGGDVAEKQQATLQPSPETRIGQIGTSSFHAAFGENGEELPTLPLAPTLRAGRGAGQKPALSPANPVEK